MGQKLKNYDLKLSALVIINILIYFILNDKEVLSVMVSGEGDTLFIVIPSILRDSKIMLAMMVLTFFLNYIIPSNLKHILVFKRLKNPLPGCRVFSKLVKSDPRISLKQIESKYHNLPVDPKEQNNKWYEIYKRNSKSEMVYQSHRNFLFARDATSVVAVICVGYLLLILFKACSFNFYYLSVLVVEYLIISQAATFLGNRFVLNAIVEDIHRDF